MAGFSFRELEDRDDVFHVDLGDFLAGDADFRNGRERDVVAIEHALQVDHGVLPVLQLGLVGRDAEAGALADAG